MFSFSLLSINPANSPFVRVLKRFPGSTSGKESVCNAGNTVDSVCGFDPCVRRIPWKRKWQPIPVFLPGKSQGLRSLVGCIPWGRIELDMSEATECKCFKGWEARGCLFSISTSYGVSISNWIILQFIFSGYFWHWLALPQKQKLGWSLGYKLLIFYVTTPVHRRKRGRNEWFSCNKSFTKPWPN